MANKVRGEIAADFEGKRVKLILHTNSICEIEEKTGVSIIEFVERLQVPKPKMSDTRLMFWAMLLEEKPDASLRDAGAVIEGLRGRQDEVISNAILAAFPDANTGSGKNPGGK